MSESLDAFPSLRRGLAALQDGDDIYGMAERSLICMMLLCPLLVPVISRSVKATDFGHAARRAVADEIFRQNDKATLYSVAGALGDRKSGDMDTGQWLVALAAFLDWAAADDDIEPLTRAVVEGSIRRRKEIRGSSKTT